MKHLSFAFCVTSLLGLSACNGDEYDGLKEKVKVETQQANEVVAERARIMELDLARRQRFCQSAAGDFEGDFSIDGKPYAIRVLLTPTVFPVDTPRSRLPEEIARDLNDLAFDIHVVQWNKNLPDSSWGCSAENIRGNIENGQIHVVVEEPCTFSYSFAIAADDDDLENVSLKDRVLTFMRGRSTILASDLLSGKSDSVDEIVGVIRPSLRPAQFYFRAPRIK